MIARRLFWIVTLAGALCAVFPLTANARNAVKHAASAGTHVTIIFGQEMGHIRPFSVTIAANGAVKPSGPIHLNGNAATISRDAVMGIVRLAQTEQFRALPSFTACPGALPDLATRYISIMTPRWQHRAGARGACLDILNQLFAVLMNLTHASF